LWDWDNNTLVNPNEIGSTQPIVKKEREKNGKYKISWCLGTFKVFFLNSKIYLISLKIFFQIPKLFKRI
jgi:hypothetical protein